MVIRMTNLDDEFYNYMGKIFGSRQIEKQTNDRFYDDNNKQWYIYVENEEEEVRACVSISKNIIKNIYTTRETYLEEILNQLKRENKVTYSTVTNRYISVYKKCGFTIDERSNYKNFVTIYMDK